MLCALESTMMFASAVLFGLGVSFFVEEVATRMGYAPTNARAKWRAARPSQRLTALPPCGGMNSCISTPG